MYRLCPAGAVLVNRLFQLPAMNGLEGPTAVGAVQGPILGPVRVFASHVAEPRFLELLLCHGLKGIPSRCPLR